MPLAAVAFDEIVSTRGTQPNARNRSKERGRGAACYHVPVITDVAAYDRLCEREKWDVLRRMSIDDSIAVLEALLTSELMDIAAFADDDHPMTLARSLRIRPDRIPRKA
jgi:hypothetical protein